MIEVKDLHKGRTKKEVLAILEDEGNKSGFQLKEWHDVFELLSECRINKLPEICAWSILSNRFKITPRGVK